MSLQTGIRNGLLVESLAAGVIWLSLGMPAHCQEPMPFDWKAFNVAAAGVAFDDGVSLRLPPNRVMADGSLNSHCTESTLWRRNPDGTLNVRVTVLSDGVLLGAFALAQYAVDHTRSPWARRFVSAGGYVIGASRGFIGSRNVIRLGHSVCQ